MDEALRDEGFDPVGSHAVFVRWQRAQSRRLGQFWLRRERRSGARDERAWRDVEELSRKVPRWTRSSGVEVMLESGRGGAQTGA